MEVNYHIAEKLNIDEISSNLDILQLGIDYLKRKNRTCSLTLTKNLEFLGESFYLEFVKKYSTLRDYCKNSFDSRGLKEIHDVDSRSDQPYLEISELTLNCGNLQNIIDDSRKSEDGLFWLVQYLIIDDVSKTKTSNLDRIELTRNPRFKNYKYCVNNPLYDIVSPYTISGLTSIDYSKKQEKTIDKTGNEQLRKILNEHFDWSNNRF